MSKVSYSNLAYLYEPELNVTGLESVPFHVSDDITEVFFRCRFSGFLYEKKTGSDYYKENFSVHYELFDLYNERMLVDSGHRIFADSLHHESDLFFISSFYVKTVYPGEFSLTITLKDINRNYSYDSFIEIQKKSLQTQQNFLLTDGAGDVLFQPVIKAHQLFRIRFSHPEQKRLFVRYYHRDFPIAYPPFSEDNQETFEYRADSLMEIDLLDGETGVLELRDVGFYQFQTDTTMQSGFTTFLFYDGFPEVVSPLQMMYPLRYLTTKKEYAKIESQPNIKQAVEEFWLENAGNPDRAVQMIRKYYSRVQQANLLFSSYLEGWKTDRGMIYIIYGKPTVVYRLNNIEQWIYGQEGNLLSMTFDFVKVVNPFSENDYQLDRSPGHKESWYMAVEGWRR